MIENWIRGHWATLVTLLVLVVLALVVTPKAYDAVRQHWPEASKPEPPACDPNLPSWDCEVTP